MDKLWQRYLACFLILLAVGLLVSCEQEDETVPADGAEAVGNDALVEEIGDPEDTDVGVEPDESADVTLDEREVLTDDGVLSDDTALQGEGAEGEETEQATLPPLLPAAELLNVAVVTGEGEEVAEVVEILFDVDGAVALVIIDSEAIVEFDGEEVGMWAMEWAVLELQPLSEINSEEAQGRLALVVSQSDYSDAAPVSDTVPLAAEELLVNTAEIGLEDAQRLLKLRAFTGLGGVNQELMSATGTSLGRIDALLMAPEEGRISYVVADAVSVANAVIPWQALEIRDGEIVYTLEERTLLEAPTIDEDAADGAIADPAFEDEVRSYWAETGALN